LTPSENEEKILTEEVTSNLPACSQECDKSKKSKSLTSPVCVKKFGNVEKFLFEVYKKKGEEKTKVKSDNTNFITSLLKWQW
jgi:hypothetical protein